MSHNGEKRCKQIFFETAEMLLAYYKEMGLRFRFPRDTEYHVMHMIYYTLMAYIDSNEGFPYAVYAKIAEVVNKEFPDYENNPTLNRSDNDYSFQKTILSIIKLNLKEGQFAHVIKEWKPAFAGG
ncbi:hypothetical protein FACS1894111_00230 [Clostridia bacterium]|nr:hypothetical protein FACS1894111_00230 [Clostridia bacterium]